MPSTSDNIIIFPDIQKLKEEVERLRTDVSMLLLEWDELQFFREPDFSDSSKGAFRKCIPFPNPHCSIHTPVLSERTESWESSRLCMILLRAFRSILIS